MILCSCWTICHNAVFMTIIIIINLSKVSDRQCKTVYDTSYEGHVETQCKPGYASKCKTVYKTGYKKYPPALAQIFLFSFFIPRFCTTVHDEECRISYETSYKTVYDKKCSTTYVKSCHDVSVGLTSKMMVVGGGGGAHDH